MTQYLISFSAHAMDHLPDEDMAAVGKAAHAVVQEAVPIAASGAPSMSPSGRAGSRLCGEFDGGWDAVGWLLRTRCVSLR
jgi:hypothetical protein